MQKARALSFNGELPQLQSCTEAWPDQYCVKRPRRHHQLQLPHYNDQLYIQHAAAARSAASVGPYVDMQDDDAILTDVPARMRLLYDYRAPAGTRWSPTREQLRELQALFHVGGLRTPTTAQISRITARLRRFGRIEGRNVFYWFQNQKARERKMKLHQQKLATSGGDATSADAAACDPATSGDDVNGMGPSTFQGATISTAVSCPSDFYKTAELSSSSFSGALDDNVNKNGSTAVECSTDERIDGTDCLTTDNRINDDDAMLELQLWPVAASELQNTDNHRMLVNGTDNVFNIGHNHHHKCAEEEVSEVSDIAAPVNGDGGRTSCRFSNAAGALQDDEPAVQCHFDTHDVAIISGTANCSSTGSINYSKLQQGIVVASGSVQKLEGYNNKNSSNDDNIKNDHNNNVQRLIAPCSTAPLMLFPLYPQAVNYSDINDDINYNNSNLNSNNDDGINDQHSALQFGHGQPLQQQQHLGQYYGQLRKQYSTTSLDLSLAI